MTPSQTQVEDIVVGKNHRGDHTEIEDLGRRKKERSSKQLQKGKAKIGGGEQGTCQSKREVSNQYAR